MISILPSEGLAPSQSAPKQNKVSDSPEQTDERSFSSFVASDSADSAADPKTDPSTADQAQAATPGDTLETKPNQAELALNIPDKIDPELIAAEAQDGSTPKPDLTASTSHESPRVLPAAEVETAPEQTVAPKTTAGDVDIAAKVETKAPTDPATVKNVAATTDAELAPRADIAQTQEAKQTTVRNAEADTAPIIRPTSDASIEANLKTARGEADPVLQVPSVQTSAEADDAPLQRLESSDAVDLSRIEVKTEIKPSQLASSAELAAANEKSLATNIVRDAAAPTATTALPDTLISVGQTQTASAPTVLAGMTPVAPSIPMAAPSEISAIILNALRNGVEPQDQLVVQLDPPELGRVSIDFKFDAQGVQQITVTSENPEALKRLRELHFELTEALKEHGLSDRNMSFQQQSDERSQPSWQMPELNGSGAIFGAVETVTEAPAPPRSNATYTQPNRLDLTL